MLAGTYHLFHWIGKEDKEVSERNKRLEELITKLEKEHPKIERILNRPAVIDAGRERKPLNRIPPDLDFAEKDGNTEYEVMGHFNPDGKEFLIDTMTRKLGYKFHEE